MAYPYDFKPSEVYDNEIEYVFNHLSNKLDEKIDYEDLEMFFECERNFLNKVSY